MGLSQSTPASLLDRLRDPKDEEARGRFVTFCGPLVYAFAEKLGVRPERRLDFTQDVFLLLFEKIPSFVYDRDLRFRGWLFTVMRNKLREDIRRNARQNAQVPLSDVEDNHKVPDLAKEEFDRFVVHRALHVMKTDFEEKTWQACWELVVNEKSGKEVAEMLGMTVAAVYQARTKVLRRLRQELVGICD
jgi:RNA polymerase sigma-70 factor (ECF subfamily)